MTKAAVLAAVAVVGCVGAGVWYAWSALGGGASSEAPALAVASTDTIDLGRLFAYEAVRGTIDIHNTGDAPLEISGIVKSCTCTEASVMPSTIAPGEQGTLYYQYTAGDKDGVDGMSIALLTNDPAFPTVTFEFRAVVASALVVDPPRVDTRLAPGESRDFEVRLGSARWKVTPDYAKADGSLVRAKVPTLAADGTIVVPFSVTAPTDASGVLTGFVGVTIIFNDARTGEPAPDGLARTEADALAGVPPGRREIHVPVTVTVTGASTRRPGGHVVR